MERKHPSANCEECPLYSKGHYVPSAFPESGRADIAFVGEAPAKHEVRKKEPFVGPSGKMLNRILEQYEIDRGSQLLSNALSCRYPIGTSQKDLNQAIRACRPRLLDEIRQSGASTVVACGSIASQSVLDTRTGISKLRPGRDDLPLISLVFASSRLFIPRRVSVNLPTTPPSSPTSASSASPGPNGRSRAFTSWTQLLVPRWPWDASGTRQSVTSRGE